MSDIIAEGGCMCGAVRFALRGAPYQIDYCHCASCRKHTGAPVSVFLDCKGDAVEFTQGERALYESSPGVMRGFCAACGSTLTYEKNGEVHIHVGAMDRPQDFPPAGAHSFPEERLPWLHLP